MGCTLARRFNGCDAHNSGWNAAARFDSLANMMSYVLMPFAPLQDGNTTLHHAAQGGDIEVMWQLLRDGADPTVENQVRTMRLFCSGCSCVSCLFLCIASSCQKNLEAAQSPAKELGGPFWLHQISST
jgi:ankyrin repeat protein